MPTVIGSSKAHALNVMMRTVAYAETIRLIPPREGAVSVDDFQNAHAELVRLGIARHLPPLTAHPTVTDCGHAADAILSALEASPIPEAEWRPVSEILGDELARLLGISSSSLARYRSRERTTPDAVAARLHFIALIVSDLAGSYNEFGIRRWFRRERTALGGRAPADILSGGWNPDADDVAQVRDLAQSLLVASGG